MSYPLKRTEECCYCKKPIDPFSKCCSECLMSAERREYFFYIKPANPEVEFVPTTHEIVPKSPPKKTRGEIVEQLKFFKTVLNRMSDDIDKILKNF